MTTPSHKVLDIFLIFICAIIFALVFLWEGYIFFNGVPLNPGPQIKSVCWGLMDPSHCGELGPRY